MVLVQLVPFPMIAHLRWRNHELMSYAARNLASHRLVPSLVGRALGSHYPKYATCKTLFYQGKIAIVEVHKEIQMSIYPGKGGSTCLLSNLVKKVGVRGCISW